MEEKQVYEIIIKTQCEEYRQMLLLMNRIIRADEVLRDISLAQTLDTNKLHDITMQKEELVNKLDALSLHIPQTTKLLADASFALLHIENTPTFQQMKLLERKCQEKLTRLLEQEDQNNPAISAHLQSYKERLELDIKISEVPMEKRQIFFVNPKHDF